MSTQQELKNETEDMKNIATDFYTSLFDTKKIDNQATQKLLKNVKQKLTLSQKLDLDKAITKEELEIAINKLQKNNNIVNNLPVNIY